MRASFAPVPPTFLLPSEPEVIRDEHGSGGKDQRWGRGRSERGRAREGTRLGVGNYVADVN